MTIYISGPISGIPDRNKKAFQKAHNEIASIFKTIKKEKVKIINPVKLGLKLDKTFVTSRKGEPSWEDYMRVCIKALSAANCVFFIT